MPDTVKKKMSTYLQSAVEQQFSHALGKKENPVPVLLVPKHDRIYRSRGLVHFH